MLFINVIVILQILYYVNGEVNLGDYFGNCHRSEETFDDCIKQGLNSLRPYYKSGLPEHGIHSLDPFFASEIPQKVSNPFVNYKLILRNVTESGWTLSHITKFKSDLKRNFIQYTQFFPDKKLNGLYEIEGTFFGRKLSNKGAWNLSLYDYVQTTTITKKSYKDPFGNEIRHPPLKVNIMLLSCKKLELHIGNLAGGRIIIENMLDWIINTAWQPGFLVLSPLINDLVSTAFTEIFNRSFRTFQLEKIFPEN